MVPPSPLRFQVNSATCTKYIYRFTKKILIDKILDKRIQKTYHRVAIATHIKVSRRCTQANNTRSALGVNIIARLVAGKFTGEPNWRGRDFGKSER